MLNVTIAYQYKDKLIMKEGNEVIFWECPFCKRRMTDDEISNIPLYKYYRCGTEECHAHLSDYRPVTKSYER